MLTILSLCTTIWRTQNTMTKQLCSDINIFCLNRNETEGVFFFSIWQLGTVKTKLYQELDLHFYIRLEGLADIDQHATSIQNLAEQSRPCWLGALQCLFRFRLILFMGSIPIENIHGASLHGFPQNQSHRVPLVFAFQNCLVLP